MKQFVCALMCLMGILGMKSAHAQCMDSVPWGTPLTFNSSCCWTGTPDNIWYQNNIYGQIYDLGDTTSDHRILSPWVQIPVSAAHDSLMLMYVTSSVCHEDYSVCVTTDGVHFDTLFRGWTPSTEDYDYDTLYMGAYAGQWVRIEICHYVLNSTYVPDSACLSENMFGEMLFELIKLESTVLPVATISVPERAYVGEGVQWMASLTRGSHTGLSYTWHSTLMGQTLTGDSVTMTYTAAGVDTVMMVASNAYGNDTVVNIIQVFDCPGVITAHPWLVNFETDYDCWHSIAAGRWIMSGNSVTAYGDGDKIFTSPALVMPTDSTGLRLYWKSKNNRYSGYVTYQVLVTTTDRFDIGSYDTLFSASQGTTQAQRSVSLAEYAGDTVYIAFRQKDQSNSYIQISDVKMYNSVAPMGTLEAPTYSAAIGDTVRYTLHLTQGDNVSYSWHSALLDSTISTIDSVLAIVYPVPGSETLTAMASNAHGSLVLEKKLGVYGCDTISVFPWSEDFVEKGSDASYNACWEISGYSRLADNNSYGYDEEDGSSSAGSSKHDFMKSTTQWGYMLTPPIAVPAVIEKNLSLWLEYFYSLMAVVETEAGTSDTVYSLDSREMTMRRRPISLAPYAGQTIRVRLLNTSNNTYAGSLVDRIRVDYDTVSVVVLSAQGTTTTDSATLFVASQLRGFVPGISYSWHSQVGGTFVTNATGDSAWVTYSAGITGLDDTVSVTVTNSYCSYTTRRAIKIIDCLPVDTLPWVETFTDGMPCWQKPAGSNWQAVTDYGYESRCIISNSGSDTMAHWVMSKAITLPADPALCPRLFWDVAGSNSTARHNYGVWVTTSEDYTDTLNYTLLYLDTNTHTSFRFFDHLSASLAAYAGQTIHVAFRNIRQQQTRLYIDNVTIRTTAEPVVSIVAPAEVFTTDPVDTAVAVLSEGSSTGLTYAWHSTMLGDGTGSRFLLNYTTDGTDTLTLVVTNAYGRDTATAVITVKNCLAISTIPFEEGFNTGADLSCWRNWNFGSHNYTPYTWHLTAQESHQAIGAEGYGSLSHFNSWLVSPAIVIPEDADGLNLDLDVYGSSSSNGGRGYVSYMDILVSTTGAVNTSHFVDTLSRDFYLSRWEHVHLPLSAYAGQTINIAFVNNTNNDDLLRNKGVWIDDLSIDYTYQPEADFTHTAAMVGDTVRYTAITGNCVSDSISYTWHSTLMDSTFSGKTISFVYDIAGDDTMQLIVTNAYGIDSVSKTVSVGSYPLPQMNQFVHPTIAEVGETAAFALSLNNCSRNGLSVTLHSSLMDSTFAMEGSENAASLYTLYILNVIYPSVGIDTIVVTASNIHGTTSDTAIVTVVDCSARALPYVEDFEGLAATDWNVSGELPDCWNYRWVGSNAALAPHVITTDGYRYISNIPDNALFFVAGGATGYSSSAVVRLPRFADSLQHLALALDYRFENSNCGTLTVGWFDSNEVFHTVRNLNGHQDSYLRDTILFAGHRTADYRIALWWEYGSSWYAAVVDNIEVFVDNSIPAPANLTVDSIGSTYARVTWDDVENATAYQVLIPGVLDTMVASQPLTLSNLTVATAYTVRVAAIVDGDTGRYASTSFTTLCHITQLPYNNDFSANSSINCWYTDYHTYVSYQVLRADASSWENRYFATQPIEAPGNDLSVSFSMRVGSADTGYIVGGVMPIDGSAFTPIDTFRFANDWQSFSFSTVSAPDGWLRVAFCIPGQTSSNGLSLVLQMDDLLIDRIPSCPMPRGVRATFDDAYTAHLEWQYGHSHSSPTTTLITLTDATSGTTSLLTVQGTDTTIVADAPYHRYHAELRTLCGADTTEAVAIDFEPAPCTAPEAAVVVDTHSVTLSWARLGSENLWQVSYRPAGSSVWTFVDSLDVTTYTIGNLQQATDYELRVGSLCAQGDFLYGSIITATTLCGRFGLPYSYDFTTGKEGCWQVPSSVSASTSYSTGGARMDDYMAQPRPIVSPEIDHSLAGTVVRYSVHADRFYSSVVKAGVCDEGGANIMWLDTIVAADGLNDYILRLDTFTGEQRHLCFYGEFITMLCDVLVDSVAGCLPVTDLRLSHLSNAAATVSWTASDGAAAYAVWLDGVLQGTTTGTTYTFAGLNSKTHYVAAVSPISVAADTGVAVRKHFTTLCPPRILPYSMNFENEYILDSICWHTILYPYANHPTAGIYGTSQRELFLGAVASASSYDTRYRNFVCSPLLASEGQDVSVSFRAALYSFNAGSFLEVGIMPDPADTAGFVAIGNVTPTSGGNTYIDHQFTIPAAALPQPFCLAFRFGGTLVRCYIDDVSITGATAAIDDPDLPVCRLYPNPATGSVTIESDKTCEVSLYDAMGRKVMLLRLTAGINNIDVSALATGVYYLKPSDKKLIIKR